MKKRHEEHVNHERWLISYADFITLLFALFVILYSTSKADSDKFKKIAESMAKAFGNVDMSVQTNAPGAAKSTDSGKSGDGVKVDIGLGGKNAQTDEELQKLAQLIDDNLRFQFQGIDFSDRMQIDFDDRGLVVRLMANGLFEPGSAEIKLSAFSYLDQIIKSIGTTNFKLRLEGHTDNSKLASEIYPSNWELSTARAAFLARYMIKEHRFDPKKIEVAGMAEYHPIASNDTPEGQAKNRRVEIVVLRQSKTEKPVSEKND